MILRILLPLAMLMMPVAHAQRVLEVGPGKTYSDPQAALLQAVAGDTVRLFPSSYAGNYYVSNIHGRPGAWITFEGTDKSSVILRGIQSIQLSDISYVHIRRMTIRGQSANGMNIDDGGTFETPSHHLRFEEISFEDMNATGNNDMLKLSGIDTFEVDQCTFVNGSAGGSGIDMVGCHEGQIHHSRFVNQGNSIQVKGGCRFVTIEKNVFINGGDRTLNLGGSTGLAYFRPAGINYEAADLLVHSNYFSGSQAPIAFVGSRRVQVSNNTFYNPTKWIFRILQESQDTSFFLSCANNIFSNNIIYAQSVDPTVNIGPYTSSMTFDIRNNLWYSARNTSWRGPALPVAETKGQYAVNPMLEDIANGLIRPSVQSPVRGKGQYYRSISEDHYDQKYHNPPCIGAVEYVIASVNLEVQNSVCAIYPVPCHDHIHIPCATLPFRYQLFNEFGQQFIDGVSNTETVLLPALPAGMYQLLIHSPTVVNTHRMMVY